jgi:hypothetical protein
LEEDRRSGIRKKSQTTFDHYTEALSAHFGKLKKKKSFACNESW